MNRETCRYCLHPIDSPEGCSNCPPGRPAMGGSFDGRPYTPSEYDPPPPWWHGLFNWRRWSR